MTPEEFKEFEQWLLRMYQQDNTVPFHIMAAVLRKLRPNVG